MGSLFVRRNRRSYPPVYVPELHDKYEGTLVEKELQRNYDCLREAKKRGLLCSI